MSELITKKSKFPIVVIILLILILVIMGLGIFLCYVWANDLAIHLIYVEQLLQNLHKPLPDPNDYI